MLTRSAELGVVSRDRPEETANLLVFRQRDLAPRSRATFELGLYPRRLGRIEVNVAVRARGVPDARAALSLTGTR